MAVQRDAKHGLMFSNPCVVLSDRRLLKAVLIVTHSSSTGPSPLQTTRPRCVYPSPFYCKVIWLKKQSWNDSAQTLESQENLCEHQIEVTSLCIYIFSRWYFNNVLIIVIRAENVPTVKKYGLFKRDLFVTVSDQETTEKTANVRIEGKTAKWNQSLNAL